MNHEAEGIEEAAVREIEWLEAEKEEVRGGILDMESVLSGVELGMG